MVGPGRADACMPTAITVYANSTSFKPVNRHVHSCSLSGQGRCNQISPRALGPNSIRCGPCWFLCASRFFLPGPWPRSRESSNNFSDNLRSGFLGPYLTNRRAGAAGRYMFFFMGVSELILPVRTALHSVTSSAVTAQKTGQGQHSPAHTGKPSLGLALHRMQAKLFFKASYLTQPSA